jgi:hypothetical protein
MVDYPEDQAISNRNSRGGRVLGEYAEVLCQQTDAKRRAEFYLDPGPNQ